ncbi:MAG: 3'-5' exonuclease [Vampirovibrio sp.]|nr:3'-5' exonuclease [Vampirovibrio sp.]
MGTTDDSNAEALKHLKSYVVLDTETTGLDYKTEEIIEIAAVKVENDEIIKEFHSLVKPTVPIRHSSFQIHNISEDMLADAPSMEEVLPKFLEFMEDTPYVAHNALFDYSFINQASKRLLENKFRNHRIDSLDMYRSVFPEEPSHSLSSLLARFGFESHVSHRAMDDTKNLAKVYPLLRELYEEKYRWQLSQLPNVAYLFERYLRLQRSTHILQAEMSDIKDVFKRYFQEGGKSIEATTGETIVSSYRRNYEYDDAVIWEVLHENDAIEKAVKLNYRAIDKMIDRNTLGPEATEKLKTSRTAMTETQQVNIVKPQPPVEATESTDAAESKESQDENASKETQVETTPATQPS